jgi:predicted outer membrane protein
MSALLRLSAGAVAVGLFYLPLSAIVAQQATTPRNPGTERALQPQSDAANPPGQRGVAPQIDPAQPGRTAPGRQPYTANFRGTPQNAGQAGQEVDLYLANCLLKHNKAEVEFAEFAQQQSQNPAVKQFAEQMAKDHQQLVQKLQPLAGAQAATERNTTSPLDANAPDGVDRTKLDATGGRPGTTDAAASATGAVTNRLATIGNPALSQLAGIERKIAERCQQALREELQQKTGAEFDECYIGSQIGGHMHMLAALEVIGQESQGQLKQLANEAQPTVQSHLEHAKQLAKQLKSESSAATAGRSTTSQRQ